MLEDPPSFPTLGPELAKHWSGLLGPHDYVQLSGTVQTEWINGWMSVDPVKGSSHWEGCTESMREEWKYIR
jgi:hypothetical protein